VAYLEPLAARLCGQCRERLARNPLRVLDCKVPDCQPVIDRAPSILDTLPPERILSIPMRSGNRSLNLSNAVAVVVYEAWRQQGFGGGGGRPR